MPTYIFEQELITCVSIEQELGLSRGDISSFGTDNGAVEIKTPATVVLTSAQQAKLKVMLNARGLGFGKKPDR